LSFEVFTLSNVNMNKSFQLLDWFNRTHVWGHFIWIHDLPF